MKRFRIVPCNGTVSDIEFVGTDEECLNWLIEYDDDNYYTYVPV